MGQHWLGELDLIAVVMRATRAVTSRSCGENGRGSKGEASVSRWWQSGTNNDESVLGSRLDRAVPMCRGGWAEAGTVRGRLGEGGICGKDKAVRG